MVKILIFGDSIAWGMHDTGKGGWVERLKIHHLQNYAQTHVRVYNLAVSSNDTRGVLGFLDSDIKKIETIENDDYILLFSVGTNDARYVGEKDNIFVPAKEFEENLQKIIQIAKKYSKRIIFTGLMNVDEKLTLPWTENEYWENKDIKNYDSIVQKLCKKNEVNFVPLIDLIKNTDLSDGLHPNSTGHEKIYNKIKDFLEEII